MEMIDPGTRLAPEINMHYADIQDANPSNITNYSYNFQMDDVDHSDAAANIDQNSNIYKVYFKTSSSSSSAVEFFPLQDHVYCIPNETTMVFFQAYNPTPNQVTGISIYMINPTEAAPYVNKVQCFCFEDMMLQPYETVELPVLFMLDADIKNKLQFDRKNVTINYIMFAK
jgi:cytochrome c oxidase assembly protein Cox11